MREKYNEFSTSGTLIMDGTILDLDAVYDDLDAYNIERDYDVRLVGW